MSCSGQGLTSAQSSHLEGCRGGWAPLRYATGSARGACKDHVMHMHCMDHASSLEAACGRIACSKLGMAPRLSCQKVLTCGRQVQIAHPALH